MSDIITRLLLKTNDFDVNLNKAKGSINSFQSDIVNRANAAKQSFNDFQGGISNMAKTAGTGIMKFAGTIGLAVGAGEALMKTIRATQATSDEFDNNINACKDSVNSFFEALSSGDFGYFENGLLGVFQKAKDLSAALDTLGDVAIGFDIKGGQINNAVQKNLNIIRNKDSSKEEIAQAKKNNNDLLAEYKKYSDKKVKVSKDALVKMYGVKAGISNPTLGDVDVYLMGGSAHMYDNAVSKYNRDLDEMNKRLKNVIHETGTAEEKASKIVDIRNEIAEYKKKHATIGKLGKAINNITDDERLELAKLRKELDASLLSYGMLEAKVIRGAKAGLTAGSGAGKPTPSPVGSLAALDAEIAAQNKKLSEATTMQARASVQATINELEQKKINLKVVIDQEVFKRQHGEMKDGELETPGSIAAKNMPGSVDYDLIRRYSNAIEDMKAALSEDVSERTKASIQAKINELEAAARALAKVEGSTPGSIYSALQNNAGNKKQGSFDLRRELPNMRLPKYESVVKQADINRNNEFAKSLEGIGSSFGILGQMANQFGEDGLAFALNSIGSISQMIMQLESLAIAKGVASAFDLPFPANLGAIATVIGAITSIFSSLPAFETGGIIPGTSFSGDRVLARVNSGEMILNSEQQSNLFKMLNSKMYGGLNIGRPSIQPQTSNIAALIAPSEDSRKIDISGNWQVRGETAYLQLHNYMKRTGKKL